MGCVRKILSGLMAVLVSTASCPGTGSGQSPLSIITGTVIDSAHKPIAGSKIKVQDLSGKVLQESVSDAEGHYCLENLPEGQYELTMEPAEAELKGNTVVVHAGSQGLWVDWVVSTNAKAIGLAKVGEEVTCRRSESMSRTVFGGLFVSGWLGSLIAAMSRKRVTSASQ